MVWATVSSAFPRFHKNGWIWRLTFTKISKLIFGSPQLFHDCPGWCQVLPFSCGSQHVYLDLNFCISTIQGHLKFVSFVGRALLPCMASLPAACNLLLSLCISASSSLMQAATHPLSRSCLETVLHFWGVRRALQSKVAWKSRQDNSDRGKVCNVLTTLEYLARPIRLLQQSPGMNPDRHSSSLHLHNFSLIHVKGLRRSRPWSQRCQGWLLWSFLDWVSNSVPH